MATCAGSSDRNSFASATMFVYASAIFLSAFLVFQVQPILGKAILPWFGGTPSVWTTCMLFFQVVLLCGYAYAHASIRWLTPQRQGALHLLLLVGALATLPITPNPAWKPTGTEDPALRILGLLLGTVGLPYLLLSSTAPLLMAWFARAFPGSPPYRLYALSNLGSMLALLSYPTGVEPWMTSRTQQWCWSAAFGVFVVVTGWCAARGGRAQTPEPATALPGDEPAPNAEDTLLWTALAACGSTLLLAVTNHLCQEVAVVPFLWVLPLALYLLSFILCFESDRWYRRSWYLPLLLTGIFLMAWAMDQGNDFKLQFAIPIFAGGLFAACMFCHGELARLRPAARHLTAFYLMTSLGGAMGGVFVGWFAPRWFCGFFELPLGIFGVVLLAILLLDRGLRRRYAPSRRRAATLIALRVVMCVLALIAAEVLLRALEQNPRAVRNFYGMLRVSDFDTGSDRQLALVHGATRHGSQFVEESKRKILTTYYGRETGIAVLMQEFPRRPRRVGLVGLGTGTSAGHGQPGDVFRFYEINPLVITLAQRDFTFLRDSPARIEIVLGDARIRMEREEPQHYDILALDAFSSDAIPAHLLTREAFALYWKHLQPDGVLAVHVSNRHLDLMPIVEALARERGLSSWLIENRRDAEVAVLAAEWILVTNNVALLTTLIRNGRGRALHPPATSIRPWSDDYSNLLQILK